tara:strand:+ start:915 stop:1115 length:201 start_codon:yes stop_codon:yes gene_type:complete
VAHSSQCFDCFWFNEDWTCDAFPKGIPDVISDGEFDHKKEFKGDRGIRFKSHEDRLKELDKLLKDK